MFFSCSYSAVVVLTVVFSLKLDSVFCGTNCTITTRYVTIVETSEVRVERSISKNPSAVKGPSASNLQISFSISLSLVSINNSLKKKNKYMKFYVYSIFTLIPVEML